MFGLSLSVIPPGSCQNYLIEDILDRGHEPFYEVHGFIRDRGRSVRTDLTFQNVRDEVAVDIHERLIR